MDFFINVAAAAAAAAVAGFSLLEKHGIERQRCSVCLCVISIFFG